MKKNFLLLIVFTCILSSCKYKYVEDNKFIGEWVFKGKKNLDGLQIIISNSNNGYVGRITKLPNSPVFKSYLNINDIWITSIERTSNFEFKISEKKIASDLFSEYGMPSIRKYKAVFVSDNRIDLFEDNGYSQTPSAHLEKIVPN